MPPPAVEPEPNPEPQRRRGRRRRGPKGPQEQTPPKRWHINLDPKQEPLVSGMLKFMEKELQKHATAEGISLGSPPQPLAIMGESYGEQTRIVRQIINIGQNKPKTEKFIEYLCKIIFKQINSGVIHRVGSSGLWNYQEIPRAKLVEEAGSQFRKGR